MFAVHKSNATLYAECMAASVNICIQALFADGWNMRMTQLDRTWVQDFAKIESMTTLPGTMQWYS